MLTWPPLGPTERKSYQIDWGPRLAGDTIVSSTWSCPDPSLTLSAETFTSTLTELFLSTGTLNSVYVLTNTVSTAGGENPLVETVTLTCAVI
jgi:hypothetical protein